MSEHSILDFLRDYKESFQLIISALGILGGGFGLYLLNKRTTAAIQSAQAALAASNAAAMASKAAAQQAETASKRHESQTNADRERRVVDAFAKANEQLASTEEFVRLGAIYTLERLSHESEQYYWPIMEILSAYFRRRMELPDKPEHHIDDEWRVPVEQAAIFTIFGRRDRQLMEKCQHKDKLINIRATELRGFDFNETLCLDYMDISYCNLSHTTISNCTFEYSDLYRTKMRRCEFRNPSSFKGSVLAETNFVYADLSNANFRYATLMLTNFENALLAGVDFSETKFKHMSKLDKAIGDKTTILPNHIKRPDSWPDEVDWSDWSRKRDPSLYENLTT